MSNINKITETSLDKLAENIKKFSDEDVKKFYKSMNPYSFTAPEIKAEKLISLSYTDMRQEYMKKFVVTSEIAYLYRALTEYKVPPEIKAISVEEYIKDPSTVEPPEFLKKVATCPTGENAKKDLLAKYELYKETMKEKIIINNFLKTLFEFNPDEHVVSALRINNTDEKRHTPNTPAAKLAAATNNTVTNTPKKSYEKLTCPITSTSSSTSNTSTSNTSTSSSSTSNTSTSNSSTSNSSNKTSVSETTENHIPPEDTFSRFNRYMDDNYEELQQAVYNLYGVKNDIDLAIIVYDKHESEEAAKQFKELHMGQFIAPVIRLIQNRWALIGPYKENQERIDFLSSHTKVLEEMIDKRMEDSKLANDMFAKSAKKKLFNDVATNGPDPDDVKQHFKNNTSAIADMGATQITLTAAEEKLATEIYNKKKLSLQPMTTSSQISSSSLQPMTASSQISSSMISSNDQCSLDQVEIPIFNISDGGKNLKVDKIYNPAEKPVKLNQH